jgi:transcriptional regulator with XRE-family HTH domain
VLRELIAEKGRTQSEMADALGTTQETISRRLLGRMRIDQDTKRAMCDFLGVTMAEVDDRVNSRYRHVAA